MTYLYLIGEAETTRDECDRVKIGITNNPWARLRELQPGHHSKLCVHRAYKYPNRGEALAAERYYHKLFQDSRMCGEWFGITAEEATTGIEESHIRPCGG